MSAPHLCLSLARRAFSKQAPRTPQCLHKLSRSHKRPLHISRSLKAEEKSFKGQLYESTALRLQRERAEQARFAKARGESSRGRNAAVTFGLPPQIMGREVEAIAYISSHLCFVRDLLLFGFHEPCRSIHALYDSSIDYDSPKTQCFAIQPTSGMGRFRIYCRRGECLDTGGRPPIPFWVGVVFIYYERHRAAFSYCVSVNDRTSQQDCQNMS